MKIKILLLVLLLNSIMYAKGLEHQHKHEKWLKISKVDCLSQGGKIVKKSICEANWKKALKICSKVGGKLPTLQILKHTVTSCGGEVENFGNAYCKKYHATYKEKGFSNKIYWSTTEHEKLSRFAWVLYFYNGTTSYYSKQRNYSVACMK